MQNIDVNGWINWWIDWYLKFVRGKYQQHQQARLIFRGFQHKCPKPTNDQGIIVDKENSKKGWIIYHYGNRSRVEHLDHLVGWCWFLDLAPHHKSSDSTLVHKLCILINEGELTTPYISRTNNGGSVAPASSLLTTVRKTQNFAIQKTELTVKGKSFFCRKWPQEDHQIPQRAMESFLCVLFETKLICRVICQVEVNILTSIYRVCSSRVHTIQVQLSYTVRAIPDKYHLCPDFYRNVSKIL